MQTLDASLRMRLKRHWWWPFGKLLSSKGKPIPTHIPQANAFTEKMAKTFGGLPGDDDQRDPAQRTPHRALHGRPRNRESPEHGAIDPQHRVFNKRNLYVVDGSMLGANLGVNPSLTITALAERAMSYIPAKDAAMGSTIGVSDIDRQRHVRHPATRRMPPQHP
jgi:cholesterol oxidase